MAEITSPSIKDIVEKYERNFPIAVACNKSIERGRALAEILRAAHFTNVFLLEGGMAGLRSLSPEDFLLQEIPTGTHFVLIRDQNDDEQSRMALGSTMQLLTATASQRASTFEVIDSTKIGILANNLGLNPNDFLVSSG